MPSRWTATLWLLAACYEPAPHGACAVACDYAGAGAEAPCPAGLMCGPQGRCVTSAASTCDLIDAAGGDDGVTIDAPRCFGPLVGGVSDEFCFTAPPTGDVVLPGALDTSTCPMGERQFNNGVMYCVIAAARISATSDVVATGALPLLLLASESITIARGVTLDASSRSSESSPGAGGNAVQCAFLGADASATMGGGAGGTFQGRGGNGGGTGAGTRAANVLAEAFHGGCPGGKGGGTSSRAGRGGGAVFLSAPTIVVLGGILAAGEGGIVGEDGTGGGGGGSGGIISLVGATIMLDQDARLIAAGGGGGAGRDSTGVDGETASAIDPVADGGDGSGNAGSGGKGSDPLHGAMGDPGSAGGGGGGGGAGFIDIRESGTPMNCIAPKCAPQSTL